MKRITTKDIIKILPFETAYKTGLLSEFDSWTDDQRLNIEEALWNAYDALYELRLQENTKLALMQAGQNQEKLDQDFYKRVREKTDKEMQEEQSESAGVVDLTAARSAMEKIISEIQATKHKNTGK